MNEAETRAELIDPLLTADDVLTYRNTQLALVEAKDYAGKLQVRFTYASNGLGVYAIGMARRRRSRRDQRRADSAPSTGSGPGVGEMVGVYPPRSAAEAL